MKGHGTSMKGHGTNQHRLGDTSGAMAAQVAGDLATAGGMPNHDRVLEIDRFE
jgi:hypothetical protein